MRTRLYIFLIAVIYSICLEAQTIEHVVQRGESFASIAQKYNISEEELKKSNPRYKTCYAGIRLKIGYSEQSKHLKVNSNVTTNHKSGMSDSKRTVNESIYNRGQGISISHNYEINHIDIINKIAGIIEGDIRKIKYRDFINLLRNEGIDFTESLDGYESIIYIKGKDLNYSYQNISPTSLLLFFNYDNIESSSIAFEIKDAKKKIMKEKALNIIKGLEEDLKSASFNINKDNSMQRIYDFRSIASSDLVTLTYSYNKIYKGIKITYISSYKNDISNVVNKWKKTDLTYLQAIFKKKAKDYEIKKEYNEALKTYNKIIGHGISDGSIYYYRGKLNYELKKYGNAEIDFNKAISLGIPKTDVANCNKMLAISKSEFTKQQNQLRIEREKREAEKRERKEERIQAFAQALQDAFGNSGNGSYRPNSITVTQTQPVYQSTQSESYYEDEIASNNIEPCPTCKGGRICPLCFGALQLPYNGHRMMRCLCTKKGTPGYCWVCHGTGIKSHSTISNEHPVPSQEDKKENNIPAKAEYCSNQYFHLSQDMLDLKFKFENGKISWQDAESTANTYRQLMRNWRNRCEKYGGRCDKSEYEDWGPYRK